MSNVWKVGTRWSSTGTKESCIVSVFRRNNIAFVGDDKSFLKVKAGDYLAIADGYTIVAVTKAITDSDHLCNLKLKLSDFKLNEREKKLLVYSEKETFINHSFGVKVRVVDLNSEDCLWYEKIGSFCQINKSEIREKVVDLYENQNKKFSIQSYTGTLFSENIKKKTRAIFDTKTKYIIPVYQRPYSWSDNELEPFINSIFEGFWGFEKKLEDQEPIFIGTMQLSEKKFIDSNEYEQYIIDGQQRLSTFLVLLKYLSLEYSENKMVKQILETFSIETQIGDEQQKYLMDFRSCDKITNNENEQNPYLRNAIKIDSLFQQNVESNENGNNEFQIDKFLEYISNYIYFVVIETYAGITKTLQIFNAINTTGLDLNGGDIFKIRMYEYLTDVKHEDSIKAFKNITDIYNTIDEKNKNSGREITNISRVLYVYKDFLMAKYDLPVVLFDFAVDTFFERLFDTLLGVSQKEHLRKAKDVELKLEELKNIVEVFFDWDKNNQDISIDGVYALNSIWWSRYGKYWNTIYVLLFIQKDIQKDERYKNVEKLLVLLNKVFFVFSVRYARSIAEMHGFMRGIKKQIVTDSFENIVLKISEKMASDNKEWTANVIQGYINDNAKKKNLICLLSAFLEEKKTLKKEELEKLLFSTPFDIEHIHANADDTIKVEEDLQNGIGNLAMLEREINRSIQGQPFSKKRERYKGSGYLSIQNISQKTRWSESEIKERRDNEVRKMINYLYGDN